jgi:hypothetical protein
LEAEDLQIEQEEEAKEQQQDETWFYGPPTKKGHENIDFKNKSLDKMIAVAPGVYIK